MKINRFDNEKMVIDNKKGDIMMIKHDPMKHLIIRNRFQILKNR